MTSLPSEDGTPLIPTYGSSPKFQCTATGVRNIIDARGDMSPEDMLKVAWASIYGIGVDRKPEKAFRLATILADKLPEALYLRGMMRIMGIGTSLNRVSGVRDVRAARAKGCEAATYQVCDWLISGECMRRNLDEARSVISGLPYTSAFTQLMKARAAEAAGEDGTLFYGRALKVADSGSNADNADLLYLAGELYENGRGAEKSVSDAARMYRLAASVGHPTAVADMERALQMLKHDTKKVKHAEFTVPDEIAGFEEYFRKISEAIDALGTHKDLADRLGVKPNPKYLFYGPPGCGKTAAARCLAKAKGAHLIYISASNVLSRFVGGEQENIEAFRKEADKHRISILFIDEAESVLPRRGGEESYNTRTLANTMLTLIDGYERVPEGHVRIVIAATNNPWLIDPAFLRPGRFEPVYIGLPDDRTRKRILEIGLSKISCEKRIDIDSVAARTEGYSGADMSKIVEDAALLAYRRCIDTGDDEGCVTNDDIEAALASSKPSVDPEEVEKLKSWGKIPSVQPASKEKLIGYN